MSEALKPPESSALLLEGMAHSPGTPPDGAPDPRPVTQLCSQLLSHLFCGRVFVWFGFLASVFVLPSYLRELWVRVCSFSFGFERFHYPWHKALIWTFWEGQRNAAFEESRFQIYIAKWNGLPTLVSEVLGRAGAVSGRAQPGLLWHAEAMPWPTLPERAASTHRVGTSRVTKTEAGVSTEQVLLRDLTGKSRC